MDSFLGRFSERSDVERDWLRELFHHVTDNLLPVLCPSDPGQLALALVDRLVQAAPGPRLVQAAPGPRLRSLPLSYRLVSVSELVTRQRRPCCSNLTWSTNQHREWIREAEQTLANHKALPRASLLLIGCLRSCDGVWHVRDASGSVHCELLSPSPLWLGPPLLFPCWNYIPQHAPGPDQEETGYLELIGSPLSLTSDPGRVHLSVTSDPGRVDLGVTSDPGRVDLSVTSDPGRFDLGVTSDPGRVDLSVTSDPGRVDLSVTSDPGRVDLSVTSDPGRVDLSVVLGVREAAALLHNRWRGRRVQVSGEVCGVCPLLDIAGKSFFCLHLREGQHTVSVLVTDPGHLCWRRCVYVGQSVCVSGLRVCALRCWAGNKVLCVTAQSSLSLLPGGVDTHTQTPDTHTHTPDTHTHTPDTHTHTPDTEGGGSLGSEPGPSGPEIDTHTDTHTTPACLPAALRIKYSRLISYKGVVTSVLSEGAGLYVIDRTVGLCLAYQPPGGRGLRPGSEIELHNVHFLYRPSPGSLPSMLCACLRSSWRVTAFSRLAWPSDGPDNRPSDGPDNRPSDSLLPRLLLERRLGVSEYLWLWTCVTQLRERLVPSVLREERVCVVGRRLLDLVSPRGAGGRGRDRDIYSEMLQEPHHCLHTEYRVCVPGCVYVSVRECVGNQEQQCWSVSLSSLLEAGGESLTQAEINAALAWSWSLSLGEQCHPLPLLLLGLLELPADGSHSLRLRDQTGSVACVVTEACESAPGGQRAAANTAWIGCLVCLQSFRLVTERFLQSNFPSYTHLDQDKYITHRHCRVYVQVSLDDVRILSPSAAMEALLLEKNRTREGERGGGKEGERGGGGQEGERGGGGQEGEKGGGKEGERGEERREREREKRRERERLHRTVRQRERGKEERTERGSGLTWTRGRGGREGGMEERREGGMEERREGGAKRARQDPTPPVTMETQGGGSSLPGDRPRPATSDPCVSMVIRVEGKEGVAWRNMGIGSEDGGAGLPMCFSASAELIGPVQRWGRDPRNTRLQEGEMEGWTEREESRVVLLFSGSSTRWFPLIQPGSFYRLTSPNTQDPSVLIGCRVAGRSSVEQHTSPSLLVRSHWRFHSLPRPLLTPHFTQVCPSILSVSDVLDSRCVDVVWFQGVVSQRINLQENRGKNRSQHTHTEVEAGLNVRLTVCDVASRGRSLSVYVDLSHAPYPPGLLPGNTLLLSAFQRRVSRRGGVYCRSLPVSCVTVAALGSAVLQHVEPPMMLLGVWALEGTQRCIVGKVRGHVVCVLYLQLQWTCSLCGCYYTQDGCSRLSPACDSASSVCDSASSVFQAEAKAAVDDGSGEAHLWFSNQLVMSLLGLATPQWEGLQRSLRVRGHLRVYAQGRGLVGGSGCEDSLLQYLSSLVVSRTVVRPVSLTCRPYTPSHTRRDEVQVKRFSRGERDFVTRLPPPLQLTCTHLEEGGA